MHSSHHDDTAGSAAAGSWFVAMALTLVLVVALIIALFAWAPWDDDNVGGTGDGTRDNVPAEQGEGDTDVDIEGDIDVNPGGSSPDAGSGQ